MEEIIKGINTVWPVLGPVMATCGLLAVAWEVKVIFREVIDDIRGLSWPGVR